MTLKTFESTVIDSVIRQNHGRICTLFCKFDEDNSSLLNLLALKKKLHRQIATINWLSISKVVEALNYKMTNFSKMDENLLMKDAQFKFILNYRMSRYFQFDRYQFLNLTSVLLQ